MNPVFNLSLLRILFKKKLAVEEALKEYKVNPQRELRKMDTNRLSNISKDVQRDFHNHNSKTLYNLLRQDFFCTNTYIIR